MIAHTLNNSNSPRITDCKTFTGNAVKITFTADRTVKHRVADDNIFSRINRAIFGRINGDTTAAHALPYIIIAFAFKFYTNALRQKRTETLSCRAFDMNGDSIVRQAFMPVTLGDLTGQHGTKGTINITNRGIDNNSLPVFQRWLRLCNQDMIQGMFQTMILLLTMINRRGVIHIGPIKNTAKIQSFRFPMGKRTLHIQLIRPTDHFIKTAKTQLRHPTAHIFGNHEKIIDDMFGLSGKAFPKLGILRSHTDRTGI